MSRVSDLTGSLLVGYICALLAFVIIVGTSYAVITYVLTILTKEYKNQKNLSGFFLLKAFFVGCFMEFLISVIIGIVWYGNGGSLDNWPPFTSLTPFVAHTPLVFMSRFVGYHGLSILTILVILTPLLRKTRRFAIWLTIFVVVCCTCSWLFFRVPHGENIHATIVADGIKDIAQSDASPTDLVVFPEYGLTGEQPRTIADINTENAYYVGSQANIEPTGKANTRLFGSFKDGVISKNDKWRLVPGGEYVPYFVDISLKAVRANGSRQYFALNKQIVKGTPMYEPLFVRQKVLIGSAICSSIMSTNDYRQLTSNGATLLTNSSSLGIFDSPIFTHQQQGLAKFMAVANARPFLESSVGTPAFALDHNGRLLAKINPVSMETISLTTNTKTTPYTIFGEWPVWLGLAYCLYVLVRYAVNKIHGRSKNTEKIKNP